jgi:hypothetical protein
MDRRDRCERHGTPTTVVMRRRHALTWGECTNAGPQEHVPSPERTCGHVAGHGVLRRVRLRGWCSLVVVCTPLARFFPSPLRCLVRMSWPWSFLNQVRVHPFQDGFAALICHPRRQSQESHVRFGHHFTDFQCGRDRIPDEDRLEKAGRLFDKRDDGPFQHRRQR